MEMKSGRSTRPLFFAVVSLVGMFIAFNVEDGLLRIYTFNYLGTTAPYQAVDYLLSLAMVFVIVKVSALFLRGFPWRGRATLRLVRSLGTLFSGALISALHFNFRGDVSLLVWTFVVLTTPVTLDGWIFAPRR